MRDDFKKLLPWEKGTPKRVNNLTKYSNILQSGAKTEDGKTITIPGHVRASINWNNLRSTFSDTSSMKITDGTKILVCRLKSNHYKITSIAIPIDQQIPPEWFKKLPFDEEAMTEAIIDTKVENILGVLNWNLGKVKESEVMKEQFSWD